MFGALAVPGVRAAQARPVIAMVLWRGESEAEQSFKAELDRMGYDIEYRVHDAGLSRAALADILANRLKPGEASLVYVQGTFATLEVKKALAGKTPLVFDVVRYPKRSGVVANTDAPGKNVTGVHDRINPEDILAQAARLTPFTHVGLVYDVTASNARQELLAVELYAEKAGFQVTAIGVQPDALQLAAALKNLARPELGVDLVYLPPDDFLGAHPELVGPFLAGLTVPSVATLGDQVRMGALYGLTPDLAELGRLAAASADKILRGAPAGSIPVAGPRTLRPMVNTATVKRLGLSLTPEQLQGMVVVDR
ncbi:MAG: ABC transporter substrate-binding protein [Desulfovibrionaceae bacterium]